MNAPLSLGIDIGGTFTDLVIHDPRDGRAIIWKESTTPDDPALGAIEGTRKVLEKAGARPEQVGRVVHATTLFTNALIERKGARTGLLTTAGFRDVLEIGRERKYELYDLFIEMPKPLVPRPLRREAMERLAADGSVEKKLDVDAAFAAVAQLVEPGVASLAVCLPHVREAKRVPVQLLESGPAAGALAGAWFGRNAGLERVLAFDMGGTTAKLALVDDGEPLVAYGFEAAREKRFLRGSGLPMQIATVELIEIGAGGGSIPHRSELGTLNAGPESRAAPPAPALYSPG